MRASFFKKKNACNEVWMENPNFECLSLDEMTGVYIPLNDDCVDASRDVHIAVKCVFSLPQ